MRMGARNSRERPGKRRSECRGARTRRVGRAGAATTKAAPRAARREGDRRIWEWGSTRPGAPLSRQTRVRVSAMAGLLAMGEGAAPTARARAEGGRTGAARRACGGWRACAVGPAGALGMRPLTGGSSLPLRASEEDGWRASGWRGRSLRRTFPSQSRATPVWVDRSNFERRRPRPGPGRRTWSRTAPPPALLEGTRPREAPGGQSAPALPRAGASGRR